jgi:hypothetical protein
MSDAIYLVALCAEDDERIIWAGTGLGDAIDTARHLRHDLAALPPEPSPNNLPLWNAWAITIPEHLLGFTDGARVTIMRPGDDGYYEPMPKSELPQEDA